MIPPPPRPPRGARFALLPALLALFSAGVAMAQVGDGVRHLIVAQTPNWDSHRAELQAFQRPGPRAPWQRVWSDSVPVLLGRNGTAWGRGVFPPPPPGSRLKVEKDGRAPAGLFQLGSLFGYAAAPPGAARWPYIQVGPWDAYIDDPRHPQYNRHVRVNPNAVPAWFESQRMRLGDAAYKWMVEIRHNQNPAVPNAGSAIFFHVRRGPDRPSAGCTTMALDKLERLILWLDPAASPHYVLLPAAEYAALRTPWRLP
jgi:hypothetical protein